LPGLIQQYFSAVIGLLYAVLISITYHRFMFVIRLWMLNIGLLLKMCGKRTHV